MADIILTPGTSFGVSGNPAVTPSYSPDPHAKYYLLLIKSRQSGTNDPTVTGWGLTWTLVKANHDTNQGVNNGSWIYRAKGTPSAGTISINFGSSESVNGHYVECKLVNKSGVNGANGVVQSKEGQSGNSGSFSINMDSAPANVKNVAVGLMIQEVAISTLTPSTGATALVNLGFDGFDSWMSEYKKNSQSLGATSNASNKTWGGVMCELKFSPEGGGILRFF